MKTQSQILEGVLVLLTRVRSNTVSMDGVERGLEVIANDLRQLRTCGSPISPTSPGNPRALSDAYSLRADIDRRTIKP